MFYEVSLKPRAGKGNKSHPRCMRMFHIKPLCLIKYISNNKLHKATPTKLHTEQLSAAAATCCSCRCCDAFELCIASFVGKFSSQ